jgi:hypothetical protein
MKGLPKFQSYRKILLLLVLPLALAITACATPSKYIFHLLPLSPGEAGPSTTLVIGVLPFTDARPSPQVLGKRILSNGKEEQFLTDSPSPALDVTYILRRSLIARGIQMVELSSWIPDSEHLKDLPRDVDVAIAGRIESLQVEATSSLVDTKVVYRVGLSARFGFKKDGKVVTRSVEIMPEETMLRFEPLKIEERLNKSLAEALARLTEIVFSPPPHGQ